MQEIATGPKGASAALVLDNGAGARVVSVRYDATQPPLEKRPEQIAELEPGLWYVDLTRARAAQVTPMLEKLTSARGVVFDVRGYPTDSGAQILPHLLGAPESDRWINRDRTILDD